MPPKTSAIVDTSAAPAAAVIEPPKLPIVDVEARLRTIAAENTAARAELESYFGAPRWAQLIKQAAGRNLTPANIESMCGNLRRSRKEWEMVQGNDKAALILSANHLLIAVGSKPSDADAAALEDALKGSQQAPAVPAAA